MARAQCCCTHLCRGLGASCSEIRAILEEARGFIGARLLLLALADDGWVFGQSNKAQEGGARTWLQ